MPVVSQSSLTLSASMHDGRLDSIQTSRVVEPIPFEIYMSILDCIPHAFTLQWSMEMRYSPSLDWFHLDATEHALNLPPNHIHSHSMRGLELSLASVFLVFSILGRYGLFAHLGIQLGYIMMILLFIISNKNKLHCPSKCWLHNM